MELLARAKALRTSQTDAEQRIWYYLRGHRFQGLKFRRQKPVGNYIVDFICHEEKLIIEIDGGQHQENTEYDARRDAWLKKQGCTVLRFWNNEVLEQIEGVLETIRITATTARSPLPQAGEG